MRRRNAQRTLAFINARVRAAVGSHWRTGTESILVCTPSGTRLHLGTAATERTDCGVRLQGEGERFQVRPGSENGKHLCLNCFGPWAAAR